MAERRGIPKLKDEQARASRPNAHVWLSASAGTGKTHVLSARVLRLLLAGVAPERILCLTFTKAGAAEMAERVHSTLARWVQVDEGELFHDLEALGEASGPEARDRARLLFAKVLDATGGGLKIQTIHSFCQSLLAAFPLEAGLVPGFKPLDERAQAELSRSALIGMIDQAERSLDRPLLDAMEALALRLGEEGTIAYLGKCVALPGVLEALKAQAGPEAAALVDTDLPTFLQALLGLPTGDIDAHVANGCDDISDADLRQLAEANRAWGSATGAKVADAIGRWLESDGAERALQIGDLMGLLVTKEGLAKNRDKEKLLAAEPGYVGLAEDIGGQLKALADCAVHVAYAREAAQGLLAGRAYAQAYAAAKRHAGVVDFDDLIGRASGLLATPGISEWIRFKLDQIIDHMLVDEAQDTNERQWDLVDAIVEEYFEAAPDEMRGALRTLFVVGDTKQAIFGFQGTSPKAFVDALERFQQRAGRTGHRIDELPLALSFRSMPAVLEVVDETLKAIGFDAVGLDRLPERHKAARNHPGRVLLLPPTAAGVEGEDEELDEEEISGEENWLADHERLHAERIAQQVKAWLNPAEPLWLRSKGRAATPGDVLILLRSRGALSRLIVARLYEAGVPVAGVDRLRLQAPLAVRDLLAALRFAVQPEDSLNLANLLVSPLIGWTQEDLLARAPRGEGISLWSHLRATLGEEIVALRELLNAADFSTPYRYLEAILSGQMDGRRKLAARLGEEARDAIDELLNAALGFEMDDHPSLQRFIDWFDRGDADIKRELAEGGDMVRVMTVHGSKGLEAPIVILADATFDPGRRPRGEVLELPLGKMALPVIRPSRAEMCARIEEAADLATLADMEEHWRLLYVGMTRAEELLAVTGALGPRAKGETPELSWYAKIAQAMAAMGATAMTLADWGEALEWAGPHGLADAVAKADEDAVHADPQADMPDWLRQPAPAEARPPRPLAPTEVVEDDVPNPPPDAAMRKAAERGHLLHALFERLPDVAPAERESAAQRWLVGAGQVGDAEERAALVRHALAVIDHPDHAALFSADALAEAPIAAVVGEQVIAGTVDRLLVMDDLVHVVDFKTGRMVPADADGIAPSHLRQMAAYHAALSVIFPGRIVRASLLYTSGPRLIDLPDDLLAAYKPGLGTAQEKLSAPELEGGPGVH
ncbi:MAG: double-strand break repair helicase AddA [Sphingobium sp.]|nr:double-strand break repair helicase AddA [Sphingobium sp.]